MSQLEGRKLYHVRNVFLLTINNVIYEIEEPIKWDQVLINISFDEDTFAYKYEFTDGEVLLEFDAAAGRDLLIDLYEQTGSESVASLKFGEFDSDGLLIIHFEADLNFNEWKEKKFTIELNVERRSFQDKFDSRFDTKVDIFRSTTLDGTPLTPLVKKEIFLHPKLILKNAEMNYNPNVDLDFGNDFTERNPGTGINFFKYVVPPFKITCGDIESLTDAFPPLGNIMYVGTDFPPGINKRKIQISFRFTLEATKQNSSQIVSYGIEILVIHDFSVNGYSDTIDYVQPDSRWTRYANFEDKGITAGTFQTTRDDGAVFLDLVPDDAILIKVGLISSNNFTASDFELLNPNDSYFRMQERTTLEPSVVEGVDIFEALNRQLEIVTDIPNVLKSDFLETGCGSNNVLLNGKLIRKFQNSDFSFSTKDWFEGVGWLYALGLTIERDFDGNEFIRCEDLDFFHQAQELFVFDVIYNYEKTAAQDRLYNEVKIGFKKFPEDSNAKIDEWMTLKNYLAPIKTNRQEFKKDINLILSSYFIEFTRQNAVTLRSSTAPCQDEEEAKAYTTDDDLFMITHRGEQTQFTGLNAEFTAADNQLKITNDWYLPVITGDQITISGTASNNGAFNISEVTVDILQNTLFLILDGTITDETINGITIDVPAGRLLPKRAEDFDVVGNIISPESAYNLEHHIQRIVWRWAKFVFSAYHYQEDALLFTFGKNNNEIVTQFGDNRTDCFFGDDFKRTIQDNAGIRIDQFGPHGGDHYYKPNYVSFDAPMTWDDINDIRKAFENRHPQDKNFGYFVWTNPRGIEERGKLLSMKFNPVDQNCKFTFIELNP